MDRVLAHERIAADGDPPAHWLIVLHGIYGAGRNWGSVARELVRRQPEWGALLVDLRQHGASQGFPPPHTIAAAAADLERLAAATFRPTAVLGHSFGGKVALAFAAADPPSLEQVWMIDSSPSARAPGGSAWEMLAAVRALPDRFDARDAFVAALVERGFDAPVARWMATNLERGDDGLRWRFELDAIEELLRDFFRTDLWPVLERTRGPFVHVVRADRSSVLTTEDTARVHAAARAALHTVPSGHWVNADNPDALLSLLEAHLTIVDPGQREP